MTRVAQSAAMRFDAAEKYRRPHPMGFTHKAGDDYGWFEIPTTATGPKLYVMVAPSDAEWQHISVSRGDRCPTWDEMCRVKDLFWDEEMTVVQFHPPKSEWISNARNCLHLWRWTGGDFPRPPSIAVGIKELGELR